MVCTHGVKYKQLEETAKLDYVVQHCVKDQKSLILFPELPMTWEFCYPHSCFWNEMQAVRNRVLNVRRFAFDEQIQGFYDAEVERLGRRFNKMFGKIEPESEEYYTERVCTGKLREMNLHALEILRKYKDQGQVWKCIKYYTFVKVDSVNVTLKGGKNTGFPDIRAIQALKREGNLHYRRIIGPIEQRAYKGLSKAAKFKVHYEYVDELGRRYPLCFGKGLDSFEMADMVETTFNSVPNCVCVSVDASRADAHIRREAHTFKFKFYSLILDREGNRLLKEVRNRIMRMKSRTFHGIEYSTEPVLCSGIMDTALANNFTFYLMHSIYFELLTDMNTRRRYENIIGHRMRSPMAAKDQYTVLLNGDDCLPMMSKHLVEGFKVDFVEFANLSGFDMRIEDICYNVSTISWCQQNPIRTAHGIRMVRNPSKVMSSVSCGYKYDMHKDLISARVHTLGVGEASLNVGVPVLYAFAQRMIQLGKRYDENLIYGTGTLYRTRLERRTNLCHIITDEARLDFYHAFGISPEHQVSLENNMNNLHLPTFWVEKYISAIGF